jgi:GDP-L-fucose synthase
VEIWGTGSARREFLHVDDLADACVFLMDHYSEPGHVNVGTGVDITIRELGETLRDVIHPTAELVFDSTKPDGMARKVLDVDKLAALGWKAQIGFVEGVRSTYDWYLAQSPGTIRGLRQLALID